MVKPKKVDDLRGNRTPNLRVWNPTRCHCAMKSHLPILHRGIEYYTPSVGEWNCRLGRAVKAHA